MGQTTELQPMQRLKKVLSAESVQQQFQNALQENAGAFVASVIDLFGSDKSLQQCDPNDVVMEALKAATLKLPINKQLGFAWIVPRKVEGKIRPQFQIGYKGYVQLAMRTGQYRHINAGIVCEGCQVKRDMLRGTIEIIGEAKSDKPIGYFAYMELLNGFAKAHYMTKAEVLDHAKKKCPSYKNQNSAWHTDFDAMAMKTTIRLLLGKYGYLTTEMASALTADEEDVDSKMATEKEVAESEVIDVEAEPVEDGTEDQGEQTELGPGF